MVSKYVGFNLHYVELTRHYLSSKNKMVKVKSHYVMLKFHYLKITISYVKPKQHYVKWPRDYDRLTLHYVECSYRNIWSLCGPLQKLCPTVPPYIQDDHHRGTYFWPIETKRGHNGPYMVLIWSPAKLCPIFWPFICGHSLKLDFFLNSYSQEFVIKVFEVSIQAYIMLYVSQFGN